MKFKEDKKLLSLLHKTIKKVGEDIENFHFNTAVSALMILTNELTDYKVKNSAWPFNEDNLARLLQILAPFAPHLADELWEKLGRADSIFTSSWPEYDHKLIKDDLVNLVVQINGKLRATLMVAAGISQEEAMATAQQNEIIKKWLDGKEIVKIIFVAGRLLNIVVK